MINWKTYKSLSILSSNKKSVETLAEKYESGECFYGEIDGSESFVVYNNDSKKTIAVRDFFGVYPLYYTFIAGEIRFSDSINDLLLVWQVEVKQLPPINHNRLVDYFDHQKATSSIDNETFFDGIYRLLPAHIMIVEAGKDIVYEPYRKLDLTKYKGLPDDVYVEKFREFFVASVKRNTQDHDAIAAHVSGGLDSSSVACVAQSLMEKPILTLHLNTEIAAADEQHYAELVPKKWHTEHKNLRSPRNFYEVMEQAIQLSALPETINLPLTFFSPMAQTCREKGVDVLLSGHCGDQVVDYGYEYLQELYNEQKWNELKLAIYQLLKDDTKVKKYATRFLLSSLKSNLSFVALAQVSWALIRYFNVWGREIFDVLRERKENKNTIVENNLLRNTSKQVTAAPKVLDVTALVNSTLSEQQVFQMKSFYETLGIEHFELTYQYYTHNGSLPNGTKVFFPFLDQELISLSLNVSNKLRFGEGKLRGILRQAMVDYLPTEIAERTTKAVFSEYAWIAFNEMYSTFKEKNAKNYDALRVWHYIDRQAFEKLAQAITSDPTSFFGQVLKATRVIYLAIWLDYLDHLERNMNYVAVK